MEFPGGTQGQYDRVMDKLGLKGTENWPQGSILHVAGPTEKGWEVVDVWESRQDFDRFLTERLGRADLPPENESRSNVTLQRENRGYWAEERGHLNWAGGSTRLRRSSAS
jgi:hypothetical protein